MNITGKVEKIVEGRAVVILDDCSECEGCVYENLCHAGVDSHKLICINKIGASEGDIVEIGGKNRNFFIAVILNFLVPVLILLSTILIGINYDYSELPVVLTALGLLILYFVILISVDKKIILKSSVLPEIIDVVNNQ